MKKRKRLMAIDPHCHWCRRKLKLYQGVRNPLPDDCATVDHLYSRIVATKKQMKERGKYLVLACYKCNESRAADEQRRYWLKIYWKAAGFPPPFRIINHCLRAIRAFKKSVEKTREYDRQILGKEG